MGRGFERHARTFTVLTFVSRLTGFVRDALLALPITAPPVIPRETARGMVSEPPAGSAKSKALFGFGKTVDWSRWYSS